MTDVAIVTNETVIDVTETVVQVSIVPTVVSVTIGNSGVPGTAGAEGAAARKFDSITESRAITAGETATSFHNSGATELCVADLPAAAEGLFYSFTVTDSVYGIKLDATGSDMIRIGGSVSSAGGTIQSTKIGSSVTIEGRTGGWFATSLIGTWVEA